MSFNKKLFISVSYCTLLTLAFIGCNNIKSKEMATEEDNIVAEAVDPANDKEPYKIVDNVIFNENTPVIVDFYADWCKPCQSYAPIFEEVSQKYSDSACFIRINVDDYPELSANYKVSSIPTTVFIMPGGGVLGKEVGALTSNKLETLVNQLIATSAGADMEV